MPCVVRKQLGTCALVITISFSPCTKSPNPQFVRNAAPAFLRRGAATTKPWAYTTPQAQAAGEASYVNNLLVREKNFGPSGPKTRVHLLAARRVCAVCGCGSTERYGELVLALGYRRDCVVWRGQPWGTHARRRRGRHVRTGTLCLAACKSLPDSLRAVLDHAAVCESRAGMGCFGGVGAALYRSFRVIGLGVNECRRCGKVVRGWPNDLRRHLNRKSCVAGWTAEVAAQSAPRRFRANNRLSMSNAHVPDERGSVAPDGAPTSSTRPTKRQRPDDSDTSNTCYGSDRDAGASRPRQPCMRSKCGGGSLTSSTSSSALQPPRHQAFHGAGGTSGAAGATVWSHAQHAAFHGAANRGVAWAHGYTVTWSGLKVPLAPLPFRCKRARILRQSGGPTPSSGRSVGDRCRSMGCGSEAKV